MFINDYEGKRLLEFKLKNENEAETLIRIALKTMKPTAPKEDSIQTFLYTLNESEAIEHLSDIKVISSVCNGLIW